MDGRPFGVARDRGSLRDLDPVELHLFSYGGAFKTDLAMSLETIRRMTPDGTAAGSS